MSSHYKFQRDKIPFVNFLKNIIESTSQSYHEDKIRKCTAQLR